MFQQLGSHPRFATTQPQVRLHQPQVGQVASIAQQSDDPPTLIEQALSEFEIAPQSDQVEGGRLPQPGPGPGVDPRIAQLSATSMPSEAKSQVAVRESAVTQRPSDVRRVRSVEAVDKGLQPVLKFGDVRVRLGHHNRAEQRDQRGRQDCRIDILGGFSCSPGMLGCVGQAATGTVGPGRQNACLGAQLGERDHHGPLDQLSCALGGLGVASSRHLRGGQQEVGLPTSGLASDAAGDGHRAFTGPNGPIPLLCFQQSACGRHQADDVEVSEVEVLGVECAGLQAEPCCDEGEHVSARAATSVFDV